MESLLFMLTVTMMLPPFLYTFFPKGSKARISNEELEIEANAYVKFNNTDFRKIMKGI